MARVVNLRASGGELVVARRAAAERCGALRNLLEDLLGDDNDCNEDDAAAPVLPVPNVTAAVLARVVDHCERHAAAAAAAGDAAAADALREWDAAFVAGLADDPARASAMITAANYLDARELLDLCLDAVVAHLRVMTPPDIRRYLGGPEMTPEEEDELRRNTVWVL